VVGVRVETWTVWLEYWLFQDCVVGVLFVPRSVMMEF